MAIPHDMDDSTIRRAVTGDAAALGQVFEHFRTQLKKSIAMRMDPRLCGRIDPSDVVQETYLDASRRLDQFAVQSDRMPLALWLRLLAMQRLVDLQRQHLGSQMRDASLEISLDRPAFLQTSSVWLAEQLVDQHDSGSTAAMRGEVQQQVQAALNEMEPLDREVLAMRHFELLSNQEIALALGISVKASSNRYIRALRRLKDFFTEEGKIDAS